MVRTISFPRRLAAVLLTGAVLAGCGGDEPTAIGPGGSTTSIAAAKAERQRPAPGTGNVQGTVLYDDAPVGGIEVKVCAEFARFGSGCSGAQHVATTGPDGEYVIANIPPMEYQALLVKVFDTDSYQFAQAGYVSAAKYVVEADRTLFVEPTHLYKSDLAVRQPASGSQVGPAGVQVTWDAYPGAAHYELSLTPDAIGVTSPVTGQRVDGTSFTVPVSLAAGTYRLRVEAFNAKSRKLAEGPERYSFTVTG